MGSELRIAVSHRSLAHGGANLLRHSANASSSNGCSFLDSTRLRAFLTLGSFRPEAWLVSDAQRQILRAWLKRTLRRAFSCWMVAGAMRSRRMAQTSACR